MPTKATTAPKAETPAAAAPGRGKPASMLFAAPAPAKQVQDTDDGGDDDDEKADEAEPDVHFEPVLKLDKLVDVKTNEEDEEPIFVVRAKLYAVPESKTAKEWKERGTGTLRLLMHSRTGKVRLVMRRDKTHKICANHHVAPELKLLPIINSDRALTWRALADLSDGAAAVPEPVTLAVRLRDAATAHRMLAKFDEAKEWNRRIAAGTATPGGPGAPAVVTGDEEGPAAVAGFAAITVPAVSSEAVSLGDSPTSASDKAGPAPAQWVSNNTALPPSPVAPHKSGPPATEDDAADGNDDQPDETEPDVHFEPVLKLDTLVEVKSETDDETTLLTIRARLYRYLGGDWKERGTGDLRLLMHRDSGKIRLVMRRDKVLKVCANHLITPEMKLVPMAKSDRAWVWTALADFADGVVAPQTLAIRVRDADVANLFAAKFNEAARWNAMVAAGTAVPGGPGTPVPVATPEAGVGAEAVAEPKPAVAAIALPQSPAQAVFAWPAVTDSAPASQPASPTVPETRHAFLKGSTPERKSPSAEATKPAAAAAPVKVADDADADDQGDDDDNDQADESEPNVHFEPVVKLDKLVGVKLENEDEDPIFEARAQLFRYLAGEWKERGVGELKFLKHRATGKVRVLMRRDKVLKVCANHLLLPEMKLAPMAKSDRAWTWTALADVSDGPAEPLMLAVRLRDATVAARFKTKFEEAARWNGKLSSGAAQPSDPAAPQPDGAAAAASGKAAVHVQPPSQVNSPASPQPDVAAVDWAMIRPASPTEARGLLRDQSPVKERAILEIRGIGYRYDKPSRSWKQLGRGEIQLLVPETGAGKVRLLMSLDDPALSLAPASPRRAVAINHYITPAMHPMPILGTMTGWSWHSLADFAAGLHVPPAAVTVAVRLGTTDASNVFHAAFKAAIAHNAAIATGERRPEIKEFSVPGAVARSPSRARSPDRDRDRDSVFGTATEDERGRSTARTESVWDRAWSESRESSAKPVPRPPSPAGGSPSSVRKRKADGAVVAPPSIDAPAGDETPKPARAATGKAVTPIKTAALVAPLPAKEQPAKPAAAPPAKVAAADGSRPQKQSTKDMTKAERRAYQEAQRAAKEAAKASGTTASASGKPKAVVTAASKTTPASSPRIATKDVPRTPASARPGSARVPVPLAATKLGSRAGSTASFSGSSLNLSHLPPSIAARAQANPATATVTRNGFPLHPSVVTVALKTAHLHLAGANERCAAMLAAFRQLIADYTTPPRAVLPRHLTQYLGAHIAYLAETRPLSPGMGNAIRALKHAISVLPPDLHDGDARARLVAGIDTYVAERITHARAAIAEHARAKIKPGDVVLTFGHSSTVEAVLLAAHAAGTPFRAVVVDARPWLHGRPLARGLLDAGIKVTYACMTGLGFALREATKVVLGAHGMLGNGALLGGVGSAAVALMAARANIPVMVACETYKFTDAIHLDSMVFNELGAGAAGGSGEDEGGKAAGYVHLLFDVAPPEFLTAVVTELGVVPVTSVPAVLREYRPVGGSGGLLGGDEDD
ncbi:hypothetical protein H9P43_009841 [Blastocladiella emersonii ATCC 22665]|nr:hypothetical protein H9P43_009841 [Blastocladiella emersonii ATCC 22665]